MFDHDRISQNRPASDAGETGNRYTPHPLTRQTPIGTVLNHPVNPITAVRWNPLNPLDLGQRLFPKIVRLHRDEPLFGGAKDDGILATPTVRIGVVQRSVAQQTSIG